MLLDTYIELVARLLWRLRIKRDPSGGFSISFVEEVRQGVDERIAMIDSARANLLEGVRVIDELRAEAARNKQEAQQALLELSAINQSKGALEQQSEEIKKVIQSDVVAFQAVAGVPSPAAVRRERIIGFISGVVASVVATGVVWAITKLVDALR